MFLKLAKVRRDMYYTELHNAALNYTSAYCAVFIALAFFFLREEISILFESQKAFYILLFIVSLQSSIVVVSVIKKNHWSSLYDVKAIEYLKKMSCYLGLLFLFAFGFNTIFYQLSAMPVWAEILSSASFIMIWNYCGTSFLFFLICWGLSVLKNQNKHF